MNYLQLLLIFLCLLPHLVNCNGLATPKDKVAEQSEPNNDQQTDSDSTDEVDPLVEQRYSASAVFRALDEGLLDRGSAALALLYTYFGYIDRVDPSLLNLSDSSSGRSVHLFINEVMDDLDNLPDDDKQALLALWEEVGAFNTETSANEKSNRSTYEHKWCYAGTKQTVLIYLSTTPWSNSVNGTYDCSSSSVQNLIHPEAMAALARVEEALDQVVPILLSGLGEATFSPLPVLRIMVPSALSWFDVSWYGAANASVSGRCMAYISATPPAGGLGIMGATVGHELFHCLQYQKGHTIASGKWFMEGTAMWVEDVLNDQVLGTSSEHGYTEKFYSPTLVYKSREYSAGTPLLMMRNWGYPELGFSMVKSSDPLSVLVGAAGANNNWHNASIRTWNEAPASIWTNDGLPVEATSRPEAVQLGNGELSSKAIWLEALSYDTLLYEVDEEVGLIEVRPILSGTQKGSVILKGGTNERVDELENGTPYLICRKAIGRCHNIDPAEVDEISELGFVLTETSAPGTGILAVLEVDTHAPKLHGTWRVDAFYSSAYDDVVLIGATLSIDEESHPNDTFDEDFSGSSIFLGLPSTYQCSVTGSAAGTLFSSYQSTDANNAEGSLRVDTTLNNSTYTCVGPQGQEISGAPAGLYLVGQQDAPWSPLQFSLTDTTLELNTQVAEGVSHSIVLTRISYDPL